MKATNDPRGILILISLRIYSLSSLFFYNCFTSFSSNKPAYYSKPLVMQGFNFSSKLTEELISVN